MTVAKRALVLLAAVAITAGCGKSSGDTDRTMSGAAKPSRQTNVTALKDGVRTAIRANVRLSTYVLWANRIPDWATTSTRGPALKALKEAAATRRKQGIQIKNLSGGYTVRAITLAPSYATATAVVRSHQRVAPYKAGHVLGKAVLETDRARILLHRLGNGRRFVVWSVVTTQ